MKFELEYRNSTWYLTGKTIAGFWLWHKDLEKLMDGVIPTINYLIDKNQLDLPLLNKYGPRSVPS